MSQPDPRLKELEDRLDRLVRTQVGFQTEVSQIRAEIAKLRAEKNPVSTSRPDSQATRPQIPQTDRLPEKSPTLPRSEPRPSSPKAYEQREPVEPPTFGRSYGAPKEDERPGIEEKIAGYFAAYVENARANLEKFIGENLISKIGIIVLILGVGIGAKYAIDNNLISPLARIVLGYIFGFGLLVAAVKFKAKYHDFSAVLLSGGMAIMYFITYFAYSSYQLIPQPAAFILMVVFTMFTVASAVVYNRQVIAHIGLVGAYAVPFLLSNNSGNYAFLFSYMAILNAGILAISIKKAWKPVFYTASVFTWLIFAGWFFTKFDAGAHFYLALITLGVFFLIFYVTKIIHGVVHSETDTQENIASTVVTSIIFYLFLLGVGNDVKLFSDRVSFFVYAASFALAILISSYKYYGRILVYVASPFTWLILGSWLLQHYNADRDVYLALGTLAVFFLIFYITNIIYGVIYSETDKLKNLVTTAITTAFFYLFAFGVGETVNTYAGRISFFSYVACFALAIIVSSYRFYGRTLVYIAYPFTWFIFGSWFFKHYAGDQDFILAVVFASVYFLIFYCTTLFYRLVTEEIDMPESTGLVLTNSFIYYGFGYGILDSRENLQQYEGLYTAAHGVLHSLTAQLVNRFRPNAIDVIQTLTVLIVTFATIAIPIQFDGNHVTLMWSVEAAALFYFGRERVAWLFECLSYPVMLLAAFNMALVWLNVYSDRSGSEIIGRNPFINGDFITGLVFVASFVVIYFINRREKEETAIDKEAIKPFGYVIALVFLVALYNTIRMEIGNWYYAIAIFRQETVRFLYNDLGRLNFITQLNYTLLFLVTMAIVNLRKVRSVLTGGVNVALSTLMLVVASTAGMYVLYELRLSYVNGNAAGLFGISSMNIAARYLTFAFVVGTFISLYEYSRNDLLDSISTRSWRSLAFDGVLYPCLLIISSCELMNVAAHLGILDADKFGISILWGVFALTVIIIGIAKAKKHLRIGAFVLLGATLLKLFLYDAADLPTIPKTILFVSLGLLMLGISFLYNKFRNVIFASVGNDEEVGE